MTDEKTLWINEIVKINKIEKHPNADTLSIATVLGMTPVVIKTGSFSEGDLASYISIDTIVPDTQVFNFLAPAAKLDKKTGQTIEYTVGSVPEKYRKIKAKKIRDVFSEGLLLPAIPGFAEGESITEYYNLTKIIYEEELPEIQSVQGVKTQEKGPKGVQLSKYELNPLTKYLHTLKDGEECVITEKLEGCVTGDTLVYTKEYGLITISHLVDEKLNVHVKSLNHNSNKIEFNKVSSFSKLKTNNNWFEIELENNTKLKITGEHLVWVTNSNSYKRVDELTTDDDCLFD